MNSTKTLIFFAISIMSLSAMNLRSQDPNSSDETNNLIINGDFENPFLGNGWSTYFSIEGWTATNDIEIGRGSIYIGAWGDTQICELDTHENTVISQRVNLGGDVDCNLSFRWGARTGDESSSMIVIFNREEIFSVNPTDQLIINQSIKLKGHKGSNVLSFAGTGTSDGLGMTIDDVALFCDDHNSKIVTKPETIIEAIPESSQCNKNKEYIVNGGFENPCVAGGWKIFPEIEGWKSVDGSGIEVGTGSIYLSGWGSTQIVELDANHNTPLMQRFISDRAASKCIFSIKYGARTGNESSSMSITLNGGSLLSVIGSDFDIHSQSLEISLLSGENVLEIDGTGTSDSYGMTIDDVSIKCECSETIPPKSADIQNN